ncbi:hypothetical protein [Gordonia sp. 'Campus']|uniref:hypothetical protein n=1 Tax=Gordonia sp. 'Campus' TaxID=2915824 RepID=UPI001EE42201|nr:hypothetical protein [Gordonia sp. 'Campus']
MASLRRMLGIGRLPDELRDAVVAEHAHHIAEFVPVALRFSGRVPGRSARESVRPFTGALALTPTRILGTVSSVPGRAGRAIDHEWTAPAGTMARAVLGVDGLVVEIPSLDRVHPDFSGTLSLTYATDLSPAVLGRLPAREVWFDVPARYVASMVGGRRAG